MEQKGWDSRVHSNVPTEDQSHLLFIGFRWLSVGFSGCRDQPAPGRSAPGEVHYQPVFGEHAGFLASPALVSLSAHYSKVHVGELNYRDKLSPQEEESSNPKSQGQLTKVPGLIADCGKCNQCMLSCCLRWKMKTGKGNFWGFIISKLYLELKSECQGQVEDFSGL